VDAPLFLSPTFVFLLLLLLIYTAYVGICSLSERKVRTLDAVDLYPALSPPHVCEISGDRDVVISLAYPDYESGHSLLANICLNHTLDVSDGCSSGVGSQDIA
jgi:hypothetical protein